MRRNLSSNRGQIFNCGFQIADFGLNGKAQMTEGIALEILKFQNYQPVRYAPCAMLFAL
jgi:hypothetical protein